MFKIAIVGCGLVGEKKHLPALLRFKKDLKIVGICDLDKNLAQKVGQKFNIKKIYTNFDEMLHSAKPDIVDICTPPQSHLILTKKSVANGAHVFLEKPMALNSADCNKMIKLAKKFKKKIFLIHNQIFNPALLKAKKILGQGKIGEFKGMQILLSTPKDYILTQKNHWVHKLPGGLLGETGPHGIYLALEFLNQIIKIDIQAKKLLKKYNWSQYEDYRINLTAQNGIGTIIILHSTDQWIAKINIIGSKGMIDIDLETKSLQIYHRPNLNAKTLGISELAVISQTAKSLFNNFINFLFAKNKIDAHTLAMQNFVESLKYNQKLLVTAENGGRNYKNLGNCNKKVT